LNRYTIISINVSSLGNLSMGPTKCYFRPQNHTKVSLTSNHTPAHALTQMGKGNKRDIPPHLSGEWKKGATAVSSYQYVRYSAQCQNGLNGN